MQNSLQFFTTKVYGLMTGALLVSGLTAYFVSQTPALTSFVNQTGVFIVLLILQLVLVFVVSGLWQKLSSAVATFLMFAYAILNGVLLNYIFLAYDLGSVLTIFLASAAFFLILALIGATTKLDLTKLGNIALIGLIVTIVVSLVNLFLRNDLLSLILDAVVVLFFVGITMYDAQRIRQVSELGNRAEINRLAVPLALSIYLDFINIFIRLLSLFGRSRD